MKKQHEESNLLKYKKPRQMNIGIIIFGIIFIYLIATIVMYITAPKVSIYEVRQGSILKDYAYTGLAIREESIVYSDAKGYINYYVEDNSKVRVGSNVYTLSNDEIELEQVTDTSASLTNEEEASAIMKIQSLNERFEETKFNDVYQFKSEMQNMLNEYTSHSKLELLSQMISSNASMGITLKGAVDDGVIALYMDGMESTTLENYTVEQLSKEGYQKTIFQNNVEVSSNAPIYKLVTSDQWNLLITISDETKTALLDKTAVKVNFKKDNQFLWADLKLEEKNGCNVAILSFQDSMVRYMNERYLDIELVLEDETGLKIPKSAETTKEFYIVPKSYLTYGGNSSDEGVLRQVTLEDGSQVNQFMEVIVYYEQDEFIYLDPNVFEEGTILLKPESLEVCPLEEVRSLKGVFCINKGYAVFKQIQILCESDDYYIVEEGNAFGLSNYDHIALDSQNMKENDVVF